jgi:hypothetical protein
MNKPNVPATRIDEAPLEAAIGSTIPVGKDPLTRDPIIDQKLGWVGKFFGYGDEKKGNIAGLVLIFSVLSLIICFCGQLMTSDENTRSTLSGAITPLFGLLTGLIGYVTGRKDPN